MQNVFDAIFYVLSFLSVYVQVFLLLTFLERKKDLLIRTEAIELPEYPPVSVVVPCYNEEKSVTGTVNSLLALDYPAEKISILIVDDGSTDRTWEVMQEFKDHPQVKIFHKKNGGKHTALNFALERIETSYIGCLDADSAVHPQALKRIMSYFFADEHTMAVAPSIIVNNPKTIVQKAQKADYDMAIYTKKMLGFLGGIHVTPGPFSIFRKKVFDDLGPYRKAHNTEDQEIALRMQEHGYKIDHCPDAYVYTSSPDTIPKLYRQRLRWIYGFIKNAFDYRRMLFRRKYGHVAFFTIPSGIISIISVTFLLAFTGRNIWNFVSRKFVQYQTVGFEGLSLFSGAGFSFEWFFISSRTIVFIGILLYALVILSLLMGRSMSERRFRPSIDILYFFAVYSVVAPFWIMKAIWNAIHSRESSWTLERRMQ